MASAKSPSVLDIPILGELPLVEGVSTSADGGYPFVLKTVSEKEDVGGFSWKNTMNQVAERTVAELWKS